MDTIRFKLNGEWVELAPDPGEMLSDTLRLRLGLTGTKVGCDELECGSCTVVIDGEAVLSCRLPTARVDGCELTTIEGLEKDGQLHPLQESFVEYGAVQCGFCIPGQIMTSYALLNHKPDASEDDIRHALKDTLCRCAGYPTIIGAVQAAGHSLETGEPVASPPKAASDDTKVVGHTVTRPDAVAKVTGAAKFADDFTFPGMLFGRALRSAVPHGILTGLDVKAARALDGVHSVLTAEDIPGEHNHGLVTYDWPAMVGIGERVRYVGDTVAIVAADTPEIADQALRLIKAEYEELPVVSDPVQARSEDSPKIHEKGNLLKHIKVRKGDVEDAFAQAEVVVDGLFHTATTEQAYIEPECSLARITDDGRIEIHVGSQIPYADRSQVARCLAVPEEQVRIVGTLIGGGFGGKEDIAGQIHAALLAKATGRPVKILWDRHESLLVHPKRHATQIRVRLGSDREGNLLAAESELYGDTGAYASLGEKVMTRATTHSAGPYVIPHVKADCYAMYTNNPPAGAFRGFGVTQSAFAVESTVDELASQLGMDPFEFRRKNALRVGSTTNTGQVLRESAGLVACLDKVEEEVRRRTAGRDPFAAAPVEGAPGKVRAWGISAVYKNTGLGGGAPDKSSAEVEIYADGTAEVRSSAAEIGQGLVTVLQMITAEELALPIGQVRVLLSDTDLTPDGGPTTASRQTFVTGNAARMAAVALRESMAATLAERYDKPPQEIRFIEGLAQVNGHKVPMGDVVGMMKAEGREPKALYEYWAPETQPLGQGGDMHFAFSFAAQATEVEVDTDTGEVRVLQVIAATDVGKVINPLGLQGQIEGGIMMGLGNALTEEFIMEDGLVFSDRLARYRMPSIVHTPQIVAIAVEDPSADGPYGAKGVGEISSIATTPAITNAIYNACGVRVRTLPVDQDWLARQLLERASEAKA
ncbi:MAG: molybdopterin cofactor-binding domain-containing protein [Anaerolineales bacterium]|jgi:xanthine dehydrogenase molybdenum-binding subunit